jgi:hypothetical protein
MKTRYPRKGTLHLYDGTETAGMIFIQVFYVLFKGMFCLLSDS